jgi:dimeric dUTPase (all-alpha-NTP-PPase superfamily)
MNLEKLFSMQKVLRDRIGYNEPDRFNKLILALLVELGECANEWRGFKFWSVNQLPHTSAVRVPCMMEEDKEYYNPLLEEYVDGLHFVLELGLEIGNELYWDFEIVIDGVIREKKMEKTETITDAFHLVFYNTSLLTYDDYYIQLFAAYLNLGEMLGFTEEQIEQAYFEKNKINHQRQEVGY